MRGGVIAVIPARVKSRRFPGKVTYLHKGKPLLFYVWDQVRRARSIDRVIIASDSRELLQLADSFGAETALTGSRHKTGSDRLTEVMQSTAGKIFLNVQADNLGLSDSVLDRAVAWMKKHRDERYLTLARRIKSDEELFNPDRVKVVTSPDGYALWFSRYPLPYLQQVSAGSRAQQYKFLEHIGVYLFSRAGLKQFSQWKRGKLEKAESLEQLRILENGGRIRIMETTAQTITIDSPEDMKALTMARG